MRIYLDTSVYNRPFDDQAQPRIWLETLALSVILQLVESAEVELVASAVVAYENSRNPFADRREWVERVMALAADYRPVTPTIRERAVSLQETGIKSLDALHVATAEAAGAAWFITVDCARVAAVVECAESMPEFVRDNKFRLRLWSPRRRIASAND